MLNGLVQHLKSRRGTIVVDREFLVDVYDPTYGEQPPRAEVVSVIDFDALCGAIDEFAKEFGDKKP